MDSRNLVPGCENQGEERKTRVSPRSQGSAKHFLHGILSPQRAGCGNRRTGEFSGVRQPSKGVRARIHPRQPDGVCALNTDPPAWALPLASDTQVSTGKGSGSDHAGALTAGAGAQEPGAREAPPAPFYK